MAYVNAAINNEKSELARHAEATRAAYHADQKEFSKFMKAIRK